MIYYFASILLLIICFFTLFLLSKHDFILMRKNVSQYFMFDTVFMSLILGFFLGRIFYILDTHSWLLFYPINFLHIIRHGGFSLFGAFIGMEILTSVFVRKKKIIGKILDITALSVYPILFLYPFSYSLSNLFLIVKFAVLTLLFVLFLVLVHAYRSFFLKDGSIFLTVCVAFSVFNFLLIFFTSHIGSFFGFSFSQIVSVIITGVSLFFLIKKEGIDFLLPPFLVKLFKL